METKTKWRKRLGSCKHDACSGGHASPPLRLGGLHKFMAQAATVVQRYFSTAPSYLQDLYIHSPDLWKPKLNGAQRLDLYDIHTFSTASEGLHD